jgi:hypothetical protein
MIVFIIKKSTNKFLRIKFLLFSKNKKQKAISYNAYRVYNNLVLPYMNEEEVGTYECRDVDGHIRRFKLDIIDLPEENEQTDDAQPDDAQTDDAQTDDAQTDDAQTDDAQTDDAQPDDAQTDDAQTDDTAQIISAQLNGQIVLACGADPKEIVQWNKLDGVNRYFYYFHLFGRN